MVIPSTTACVTAAIASDSVATDMAGISASAALELVTVLVSASAPAPDRYTQPDCAPDSTSAGTSNSGLAFFFVVMSACLLLAGDEIQESRVVLGGPAARSVFPNGLPLRGCVIQIDTLPDARQKQAPAHLRVLLERLQSRLGG